MMSPAEERRFTVPPEVLSYLVRQGWQRQPLVIKQAFPTAFLNEQDTFDAWRSFVESEPSPSWVNRVRLYRGSTKVANVGPFLPAASDTCWPSYLQRLGSQTGEQEWGLCLTDPQLASPKIFKRLLAFLDSLYRHVGFPKGGCSPDLFMMNHKVSFIRLHKDSQDVFTFVIAGWRRFLLWPFDTFAGIAGLNESESRVPRLLYEVDYEAHRPQAVVLEAQAGDLLYWPAEWWHVGESNGDRAISLAVGIVHDANPMLQILIAAERLGRRRREKLAGLPWRTADSFEASITAYTDWIQGFLADGDLWAETRRGVRSWMTRCGLKRVPPPAKQSRRIDDEQWIAVTSPSAIAFDGTEESIHCSIAGHDLVLKPGTPARALLTLLSQGGVHQVRALIDAALTTCHLSASREQLRDLLEAIEANHGCEILDASDRP